MKTNDRRCQPAELGESPYAEIIGRLPGDRALPILSDQLYWMCELAGCMSAVWIDEIHKPYSWTIRQVFSHCVDAERAFGDRMWRTAANDPGPLAPFDENEYARARYGLGTVAQLITELGSLRQANLALLQRITPRAWDRTATVEGRSVSVRGWAWIAAGHLQHHFEIIEARCGIAVDRHPPRQIPM